MNTTYLVIAILLIVVHQFYLRKTRKSLQMSPNNQFDSRSDLLIQQVDEFLTHWDNFAQGNGDVEYLNANAQHFSDNINKLFEENNEKIVPRVAFYFFVQVFYFLEENTQLYSSLHRISGGQLIAVEVKDKGKLLDSSLMWKWWKSNSHRYPKYPLLDKWINSSFAKETVIPQYERLSTM